MNAYPVPSLNPWFPPAATDAPAPRPLRAIGVIGTGRTATGIAHWCAVRGFGVILQDNEPAALTRAVEVIRGLFREMEARNEITHAAAHKAMGGIGITTGLEDMEFCDMLVDTLLEDAETKRTRFTELARVMPPESILAAGASVAGLEELVAVTATPERLIGLQFFDPVHESTQVQVVIGSRTARATAESVLGFIAALDKRAMLQGAPRPPA
ncbi:putative 3-hydroxybutyryl-CoA dehydrogenase [Lacunisphaera limnophila]|uniref:Putative 3-hydroxybutyryl-CoA dehydrogenase n=1 Tax=Lacunisphaera limnophila TaxID=1838286 RepID=A0A1D8AUG0_9BACT|nr:3-hydroxyacyl-CoA dehydrogenase NAD-binding domain-containing protein [Lacunisphaera limnophila]AOS44523.1 putative 3-hydroxybutyryl-CoA dehydrogenase [Lacunisphaera limnophila]